MTVFGADAMQALVLSLQTIGVQIYTSEHYESGNLFWEPTLRDLLVGDDKKYL